MQAFQAYSNKGSVTALTAKDAAIAYFDKFPTSRKCDIREGTLDGHFFQIAIGRNVTTLRMNDVTKKMIETL